MAQKQVSGIRFQASARTIDQLAETCSLTIAPVVGFEPTVVSLTGRCLTNLATPEYFSQQSGWSDLNRRSRAPEARGIARLSHTLITKSVQRESNSQFLLGKEMGYHYTMDAFCWLNQIVKDQEHRVRIELTQPLYESGVIPLDHQCLFIQWDRWVSNPHRPV